MARWFRCDYCGGLTNLDERPRPAIRHLVMWTPLYELTTAALARAGRPGAADEEHWLVTAAIYCGPACADEATYAERAGTNRGGT